MEPPLVSPLQPETIHLLRATLDPRAAVVEAMESVTSQEERRRADRFRSGPLRRRHVVGRGFLRMVLGEVVGCPPEELDFVMHAQGKPVLASPGIDAAPSFNVSHSGDHLLIGLAMEGRLGVDLEIPRPTSDLEALARRNFADEEVAELLALPPEARTAAFFRGWTRKEAFVKAVGGGLSIPLSSFAVRLDPVEGNALIRLDAPSPGEAPEHDAGLAPADARGERWWISSVSDDDPAVEMAVAWDREPARVLRTDLTGEEFLS